MNKSDEVVYLGRVISLLAKHQQLSLGDIRNKTRHFLRKRHQTDSSLFNTLELFVTQGMLIRKVHKSRIYYALSPVTQGQKEPQAAKIDLIETGVDTTSELMQELIKQAKKYQPKAPPPTSVEGFK